MSVRRRLGFDVPLLAATIALVVLGVFFVFSSSGFMAREKYNQSFHFMIQQVLGAVVGLVVVAFLVSVRKSFFLEPPFVHGLLAATIVLLALCLVMPSVARTNRWIVLPGLRFQPSELAKVSLILFLATYAEAKKGTINELKTLAVPLAILVVSVVLVLLEPDFGTAVLLAALAAMILFLGGVKVRYLAAAGLLAAALFGFYLVQADYRVKRIQGFFSAEKDVLGSGYQVDQSKLALGSGGLVGSGLGQSTQKLNFLPFAHTDFIFAILGEETGLLGTLLTLALYLFFLWRA
jgi:cell division protein FtsW